MENTLPWGIYLGIINPQKKATFVRIRGEYNRELSPSEKFPLPCSGSEYVSEEELADYT